MARKLKVYEQSMSCSSYNQVPTIILKGSSAAEHWCDNALRESAKTYKRRIGAIWQEGRHLRHSSRISGGRKGRNTVFSCAYQKNGKGNVRLA